MFSRRAFVTALLLVCASVAMPAVGGLDSGGGGSEIVSVDDRPTENETIVHRNPDVTADEGDIWDVHAWLVDRLADEFDESVVALGEGEFDEAKAYEESYQLHLAQLEEISVRTGTESQVALFEQLADEHTALIEQLEEYDDLRAEYDQAREAGDDERARELARELAEREETIEASVRALDETAAVVEEETGVETDDSRAVFTSIGEELDEDLDEIHEAEFEETELTIDADEDVSFLEPLDAEGNVTTPDGEPLDAEEITVRVGANRLETDLDDGEFEFEYRPTGLPLGTESLTVRYEPEPDSPYAGSETTVPISIEQVEPTLTVTEAPTEVAYRDNVTVAAELEAGGDSVDGVPIVAEIEPIELGSEETDDGTVALEYTVPADVSDGEYELLVEVPFVDQSIAGVESTESLVVTETDTELAVETEHEGGRELLISGTFSTGDDEGVAGEHVDLFVGGVAVETTRTDAEGGFTESVTAPDEVGSGPVEVQASYDGAETNLADAEASETVALPRAGYLERVPVELWLGLGILAIVAIVVASLLYRHRATRRDRPLVHLWDRPSPSPGDRAGVDPPVVRASAQLSSGRADDAVRTCYDAVRDMFRGRIDDSRSLTHREFLQAIDAAESIDQTERVRAVVDGYERASYRPRSVSADEAKAVLEQTVELFEDERASAFVDD